MKKQDTVKVVIAVVCLVAAGVFIFMQFGGGKPKANPNQQIGDTGVTVGEVQSMTPEELEDFAEEQGAISGGEGVRKPTPRRR